MPIYTLRRKHVTLNNENGISRALEMHRTHSTHIHTHSRKEFTGASFLSFSLSLSRLHWRSRKVILRSGFYYSQRSKLKDA